MRSSILESAAKVIAQQGADNFTLSRVAGQAGLSIGGLRYHFGSKQDLLTGLVDHAVSGFDRALADAGDAPGAKTRAYVAATLDGEGSRELAAALIACVAVDSDLLNVLRQHFISWQEMLDDDGVDPATAALVRLAMDGWWLAAFVDLAPPGGDVAEQLRRTIDSLIAGAING